MNECDKTLNQLVNVNDYDKYYKWRKGRNYHRIFDEYRNVPISVLFYVKPCGIFTEIRVYECVDTEKIIQCPVEVSNDTTLDFEQVCNECDFQPFIICFINKHRKQTLWGFRLLPLAYNPFKE